MKLEIVNEFNICSFFIQDEDDLSRSSRNLANLDDHNDRLVYLPRRRLDSSHSALQARLQVRTLFCHV